MSTAPLSYAGHNAVLGALKDHWGWLLALGIVFILLGTIGVLTSVLFTIVSVVLFGALLLAGGVLQLVDAYRAVRWKGRLPHILIALLYGAAGIVMVLDPLGASVALTLVLAAFLIAVGVVRLVMAYQMRDVSGWGWALGAGIASVLLGGVILFGWPQSGLWVIGLIVAVELMVSGWLYVFLALGARRTITLAKLAALTPHASSHPPRNPARRKPFARYGHSRISDHRNPER